MPWEPGIRILLCKALLIPSIYRIYSRATHGTIPLDIGAPEHSQPGLQALVTLQMPLAARASLSFFWKEWTCSESIIV